MCVERNEVVGYIDNVSEDVCSSNSSSSFYPFVLQTKDNFSNATCFNLKLQSTFIGLSSKNAVVQLRGLKKARNSNALLLGEHASFVAIQRDFMKTPFLQCLARSRMKKDLICFEFWFPSRERLSLSQFLVFINMLSLWLSTCKNLWSKSEQNKHQINLEYICSTLLTTQLPLQHWNKLMSRRRVPRNHFLHAVFSVLMF